MGKIFSMLILLTVSICTIQVESIDLDKNLQFISINKVIKGMVEDDSWMQAQKKQELKKILEQYYTGTLLEDTVEQCWLFIILDTDWYGTMQLSNLKIEYIDENEATVLAFIKETDTTHIIDNTTTFSIKFILQLTNDGWRIKQMIEVE